MKIKFITTILVALLGFGFNAQAQRIFVCQVKPLDSDLWGFVNQKGEFIIKPQFEKCFEFSSDGLAPVLNTKTKQYYFINLKGEKLATEITEFELQNILGFDVKGYNCGLVAVRQGKKWGFLNTEGKLAIPIKYDDVTEFTDGYSVATIEKKNFVLNTKGEEFAIDEKDVVNVKHFTEELAPYKSTNNLFGFIGKDGKIAIQAQFESVGYFSDGLAWAKTKDGILGYINPKGEWIIKPQFTFGKNFDAQSGLARIKIGDKFEYVNKTGEILYVNDTEDWGNFSNGLADGKKNKKIGFFNNKGQWVIQPQFDAVREFKNGYAAVKKDDKWGAIDMEGNWIIQPTFSSFKDFELVQ